MYEIDTDQGTFCGTFTECAAKFKDFVYLAADKIKAMKEGDVVELSETMTITRPWGRVS